MSQRQIKFHPDGRITIEGQTYDMRQEGARRFFMRGNKRFPVDNYAGCEDVNGVFHWLLANGEYEYDHRFKMEHGVPIRVAQFHPSLAKLIKQSGGSYLDGSLPLLIIGCCLLPAIFMLAVIKHRIHRIGRFRSKLLRYAETIAIVGLGAYFTINLANHQGWIIWVFNSVGFLYCLIAYTRHVVSQSR
jgi:hypothetical protein